MKIQCKVDFREGIDIRADGGYCVAPPSTINGSPYEWIDPATPIAPAPAWLLEELAKQGTTRHKRKSAKAKPIPAGNRNQSVMLYAFSLLHGGLDPERLEEELLEYNADCCNPPLPESEVAQIAVNVIKSHQENAGSVLHTTDLGNAKRMSELYRETLRYVCETKQWLEKQGSGVWRRVDELHVLSLARKLIALIYEEMFRLSPGSRQSMAMHAQYTESNTGLKNAVDLFRSEPGIALSASNLDCGDWLLPVQNGLIDLQTGTFTPMRPDLHITYTAAVDYDPNATCPIWERFLLRIMNGDVALVEYLRRAIGYTLTTMVGCQHWRENGYKLNEPKIIANEVAEYRSEMDIVNSWLSEFTRNDPDGEIHFGDTYKFFKAWSESQYNFSYSGKRFGMILADKGYKPASKPHRVYKGLRLVVNLEFNENTGAYVGHEFYDNELELRKLGWQKNLLSSMADEDFDANCEAEETTST